MQKLFFLVMMSCGFQAAIAQADTAVLYRQYPYLPAFKLTRISDSTTFTKDDLNKKKATIIMMFSPDCEHCQAETRALTENIYLFTKAQIIMVSPLAYPILKKFYDEYHIADYPNITIARDANYLLGTFFKVRSYPAFFLYDKKEDLITAFTGSVSIEKVAEALK